MRKQPPLIGSSKRAISLVEMLIAVSILSVVLLAATSATYKQSQALSSIASVTAAETTVQGMLVRIEQELNFASGGSPKSWMTADLAAGSTARVEMDQIVGFPDTGFLIVDPGTGVQEYIGYDSFDLAPRMVGLTRGAVCSVPTAHVQGAVVLWAGLAEHIANQVNPTADQWDGRATQLTDTCFFRGMGTGFSYRVPTDPNGGSNFIENGEIRWGATVRGVPTLNGWSVIYYEPVATVTEADRRRDFNSDGDRADTFQIGRIRLRSWDASDPNAKPSDMALCPPMVLQEQCNWAADLDNDGFADPIFLWDPIAHTLQIRLTILAGTVNMLPVTRRIVSEVWLRNGPAS